MNRRSYPPIKKGADGKWHAWVTVGNKPNGRLDRRHVERAKREDVEAEVDRLIDQRKTGRVTKAGRKATVEEWLTTYLDTIAPRRCDPNTIYGYRSRFSVWVIPTYGRTRIDQLTAENLDSIYVDMLNKGRAESSVVHLHRILGRALEVAYRRGIVPINVAKLIDSPTARRPEISPLTEKEALQILAAAEGRSEGGAAARRNAARWSVGLALGLRQGEALGLRWRYVDLEAGLIQVWWQLHRRPWEHGCEQPCGRRRGGNCPDRRMTLRRGEQLIGGLVLKEPKGKSKRTVPIPPELVVKLKAHREVQALERQFGGSWVDHDLVFADVEGGPIDPGADRDDWLAVLAEAKVRHARVHDGRHTAATLMIVQGTRIEVVQEVLGHSSLTVTRGYVHVASEMARAATEGMGRSLLGKRSAR